jgi:hypothetical protein
MCFKLLSDYGGSGGRICNLEFKCAIMKAMVEIIIRGMLSAKEFIRQKLSIESLSRRKW